MSSSAAPIAQQAAPLSRAPSRDGWKHMAAGGSAGSIAVAILHPFDVIKTRLQVQDGTRPTSLTYRSTLDAVRVMWTKEGWRAFYGGLAPAWLGSGVAWGAYFFAYERLKTFWQSRGQESDDGKGGRGGAEDAGSSGSHSSPPPAWHNTASAAQAGAMVCLLTNPIWLIKTRLQLQQTSPGASSSSSSSPSPSSSPGSTSVPSHSRPAAGPANPLSSDVASRAVATSNSYPPSSTSTSTLTSAVHGRSSGEAAAAAVGGKGRPYKGMIDAFIRIGKEEGIRGYYKGLGPSLILQTFHGAIQFTVYEELKRRVTSINVGGSSNASGVESRNMGSSSPNGSEGGGTRELRSSPGGGGTAMPPSPSSPSSPLEKHQQPQHRQQQRQITSLETSACAVLSKLAASVATYPSQVIRSRVQQRSDLSSSTTTGTVSPTTTTATMDSSPSSSHPLASQRQGLSSPLQDPTTQASTVGRSGEHATASPPGRGAVQGGRGPLVYRGALEAVALTWRNEGLRGFYRGLGPALVRVLPQSAVTLTAYEGVLQLLDPL